jgi:conjugal transfer pilus assembly protein TraD
MNSSLSSILAHTLETPEQKALAASVLLLGGVYGTFETGLLKHLASWSGEKIRNRFFTPKSGVQLGPIFLNDSDRVRHSHIVGSSGSGKTEATKLLIFEDIRRNRGCFIIDAKGDRELYDEVKAFCEVVGREKDLQLISATFPKESSIWNPCGLGNASELQSKFLNSNLYSEAFYAKACELGLLQAFNTLTQSKPDGFGLLDLVRELKYMASQQKNENLEGLFLDFGSLAQSEWAEVLGCTPSDSKREISLLDIVQKNQILFVHLPTEGKSIQSSRIGRLLTQELILISGLKKSYPILNRSGVFSVFIDEFDAFATESFITFLNKGRSSHFMIHIAHQTLSDLKKISPEFLDQVLGNCNIRLIFRQDVPDDAELWSRFMGTRTVTKQTYQTQDGGKTGLSSNRESQEFVITPDEIKSLGVGQCVVSVKTRKMAKKIRLPLAPQFRSESEREDSVQWKSRIRNLTSQAPIQPSLSAEAFDLNPASAASSPVSSKWNFLTNSKTNLTNQPKGE